MPGSDGYDIPRTTTIKVTEGIIKDQPVFFSRLYSGSPAGCQLEWADFNRIHGRVQFHHNIFRLFPQSKYGKTHPEFYPMKDGKVRYIPESDSDDYTWEPCLSAPGSVEEAVKNIIAYFKEYPDDTSFSLGVNDSYEFCRCPTCLARISGDKNYLGFVDYSNMYYEWCNKVIEGVLKVYPDKWFGCLAYYNVSTPPTTVKLHPRLIPYITYDRMAWIDADAKAAGHTNTESWQKASTNLGWYDYIYGTPYCLPRVYFHESAKYLSYGAQHGVRAHYAELYPNWGEGPKPYIFAKLWWNPNRDVDALLKDWYERCVGPDAAPYLAEYYAIWERFWTKDIRNSDWFIPSTFMNFSSASYLADVKQEDIRKSRELLETAIAKCRTEKQRARAQILEKAFQYYEASALAYQGDLPASAAILTEDQALKVLSDSETAMSMDQKRRYLVTDVYTSDPILKHPRGIDSFAGTNWGTSGIWRVVHYFASAITLVLLGVHIGLNWAFIKNAVNLPRAVALPLGVILLAAILGFGGYSFITSNFSGWIASPFTAGTLVGSHELGRGNFTLPDGAQGQFTMPGDGQAPGQLPPQNGAAQGNGQFSGNGKGLGQGGNQQFGKGDGQGFTRGRGFESSGGILGTLAVYGSITGVFAIIAAIIDNLVKNKKRNETEG
jgi:hypothetical protein